MRTRSDRITGRAWLGRCACLAASLLLADGAIADSAFDGSEITTHWEYWSGGSPGAGGTYLATTDTVAVVASDLVEPDLTDFHASPGNDFELWDVDFWEDEIRLTYTSIAVWDYDHQYMYLSPVGFHFQDEADELGPIQDVQVDVSFAPFGFDPALVSFDEDDIWVDLAGSMCHFGSMGSMPSCTNPASPTGFDNEIVLIVTVPEPDGTLALAIGGLFVGLLGTWRKQNRTVLN